MPNYTCPACGFACPPPGSLFNEESSPVKATPPLPGMFTVCNSCGAICRLDAQLKLFLVPRKALNSLKKGFPKAHTAMRRLSAEITLERGLPLYEPPV